MVAFGLGDDNRRPLLAIGEVKWGETMGMGHLERLRRIRALLASRGRYGAETARLACYSAAGFDDALVDAAEENDDIVLISAADLY